LPLRYYPFIYAKEWPIEKEKILIIPLDLRIKAKSEELRMGNKETVWGKMGQ